VDAPTQGDLLGLAGVYGYVACVVLISWLLRERVKNPRKIVHILVGGIVFFWWSFDTRLIMAGLAAFPFVPILLLATPRSPVRFLRESVLGARSSEGHAYGLVMYAVSWTIIAYALFDDLYAASIAIAAMSFGDGMGELVGRRFGRVRYMPHRTLEGSLAVFGTTFASVLVLTWFYFDVVGVSGSTAPAFLLPFALAVGGLVAFMEAITPGEFDNLVIPLVTAGFLHTLGV
jgi:dolichol kinase